MDREFRVKCDQNFLQLYSNSLQKWIPMCQNTIEGTLNEVCKTMENKIVEQDMEFQQIKIKYEDGEHCFTISQTKQGQHEQNSVQRKYLRQLQQQQLSQEQKDKIKKTQDSQNKNKTYEYAGGGVAAFVGGLVFICGFIKFRQWLQKKEEKKKTAG